MTTLTVISPESIATLPTMIDRAASALVNARSSAEVLEARDIAGAAYDAAKRSARLAKAKDAHDTLIAAAHRAQADALEIEAGAKRRIADEYDAAQDRGEFVGPHDGAKKRVPNENPIGKITDIGLTKKDIHEARTIRDAEEADPGIIRRALDEAIESGEEPTRAKIKRAVKGKTRNEMVPSSQMDTASIGKPNGAGLWSGSRIDVPDGQSLSDMIRRGLKLEASGAKAKAVAKQIGMDTHVYRQARDIVLLADRGDLSKSDSALVREALSQLDGARQAKAAHDKIKHIVVRIWGTRPRNNVREAQRLEAFKDAVTIVVDACDRAKDITLPHLNREQAERTIKQLRRAQIGLDALKSRIEKAQK